MSKLPSVRKHSKGYFFIRIQGKDHYLGGDKSSASAQANLLLSEYLRSQSVPRSSRPHSDEISIEEVAILFLLEEKKKFHQVDHDTGSFGRSRLAIKLLIDLYGREKPSDFGPLCLKHLREKLVQAGLARTTINTRINIVRSCFRFAVENEMCSPSVYTGTDIKFDSCTTSV